MRILMKNGFYGLLLMHMGFALDSEIPTACTDGRKIYFCPKFINELSDGELDFVLMHEILHVALRHCLRTGDRDPQLFNIACDIVVNSNILLAEGMDINAVTIKKYGALMHKAPNGEEGNKYTAEEVYEMLIYFFHLVLLVNSMMDNGLYSKKKAKGFYSASLYAFKIASSNIARTSGLIG